MLTFNRSSIYGVSLLFVLLVGKGPFISAQNLPKPMAEKDYMGYLFAYFTGNQQEEEAVRFALSLDGYHYKALNKNLPVLDSKKISTTGGVRDPHILRSEDGKTFYMVLTDMVSAKGWDSNRAMVLLKSVDLINWTSHVVNIQQRYANQEKLLRVWAPQTIYDPQVKKYMVYWSMKHGDEPDKIYYAYANPDFSDLEGEPKQLFFPSNGKSCIDGDIVLKDSTYYLFYKTEGHGNGIKVAKSASLTSGHWDESPDYKQQTTDAVEGSCVFKQIGTDTYVLMYDVYGKGKYQFTKSTDLENFSVIDDEVSMDFHPRHGTVIPITRTELNRLINRWGNPGLELGSIHQNPVLEGYYADPEILYAEKTKKYYLYPTSDGFDHWGGYYFKAFSSDNLVDWKDEGIILDLKKEVPWAGRNAWAPAIEEKKVNGAYKYFYYYSGAQKIGVAVADDPAGPFRDIGKPLIATKPPGVRGGQEIDPDVFTDPKSGKSYLYWGNGYMAVAELNKDMVSIKENTLKVITPDKTFREGTYVFYRKGRYYFLWSEDDTRSENYRVRYGTSKSPLGPIEIPENNLILAKNPALGIYGTGHNSVLQIPGKDEWYIVYHRFSRPDGIKMGDAAGYHREVCMDRLFFSAQGEIEPVKPSLEGIRASTE
ncbi:family 43 glycosylhydrolase [Olivibacter sp. XZL3]|uniref:family 43 glycosylhydrolase n=1 Tax=Olivibacter sp. XZL3 TaxID=1735116 RepID=UPI001066A1AD|nr:family 43 glycosylhydrolase [Olivibacter sp. XZL3]